MQNSLLRPPLASNSDPPLKGKVCLQKHPNEGDPRIGPGPSDFLVLKSTALGGLSFSGFLTKNERGFRRSGSPWEGVSGGSQGGPKGVPGGSRGVPAGGSQEVPGPAGCKPGAGSQKVVRRPGSPPGRFRGGPRGVPGGRGSRAVKTTIGGKIRCRSPPGSARQGGSPESASPGPRLPRGYPPDPLKKHEKTSMVQAFKS